MVTFRRTFHSVDGRFAGLNSSLFCEVQLTTKACRDKDRRSIPGDVVSSGEAMVSRGRLKILGEFVGSSVVSEA